MRFESNVGRRGSGERAEQGTSREEEVRFGHTDTLRQLTRATAQISP
jgi:hypothetical protein